jgi:hypothetical protein
LGGHLTPFLSHLGKRASDGHPMLLKIYMFSFEFILMGVEEKALGSCPMLFLSHTGRKV